MKITLFSVYFYSVNNENADKPLTFLNDLVAFYNWYSEPMSVIIFLFFLVLSIRLFVHLKKNKSLKAYSKSSVDIISKWVKALLICMTILGALWPLILISPYFLDTVYDVHYYPIEILLVFFIYWVAFVGYHKIKVIYPSESKVIVSGDEAYRHLTTLCKAMNDDKLYLDPELNREKVAAHLHLSPKVISSVLNQYANQNFNDFVNSYRVNEVVDRLESGKVNHLTLSGIALDSGFNSQATFQRVFKSVKGMSPKEFQSLVEQKVKN